MPGRDYAFWLYAFWLHALKQYAFWLHAFWLYAYLLDSQNSYTLVSWNNPIKATKIKLQQQLISPTHFRTP